MSQKVAIVTGASQGIGAGIAQGYLDRGFSVIANSRSISGASTDKPNIVNVCGDIGDPAVAQRVVQTAVERFGRVDTLVNNAGIFIPKPFVDYTPDDYARVLQVNLAGFF